MEILIKELYHYPEYVELAARWAYRQWHERNHTSFKLVVRDYAKRRSLTSFPKTWLALVDDRPVGMVSLKESDLQSLRGLGPWLSALFVTEKLRGRGIGTLLVKHAVDEVRILGYKKVYLFTDRDDTEKLVTFYSKLGWEFLLRSFDIQHHPVTVMSYAV